MLSTSILFKPGDLSREFSRCCKAYRTLKIFSAWGGDPRLELPYSYLRNYHGKLEATIGRSFDHTHPDAIELLMKLCIRLRIVKDSGSLFHPKIYFFKSGKNVAIFIGSSNLTYAGFMENAEANILWEGISTSSEQVQIEHLAKQLEMWNSDENSITPNDKWLERYRKAFELAKAREHKYKIRSARVDESERPMAGWVANADWETYYRKVLAGFRPINNYGKDYFDVLGASKKKLGKHWDTSFFEDLDRRRIMGGMKPYGALGHVGASGGVRSLLANGTIKKKTLIVDTMNEIALVEMPCDYDWLKKKLDQLVRLGPSMKVWGRFLCIDRPDILFTVSSVSVRKNLAKVLGIPATEFSRVSGYIELARLIHRAPWFLSKKPSEPDQLKVWLSRAAFIDVILHGY